MKHLKHAYFGELNTEGLNDYDILWKENIPYKNESVRVKFWFCGKDDLSVERLDSFEKFLKNFDAVDEKARKALKTYLEEEPEYMNFHVEELENIPKNVDDDLLYKIKSKNINVEIGKDFFIYTPMKIIKNNIIDDVPIP